MKRAFFYGIMLVFLGVLPAQAMPPGMSAGGAKAASPADRFASADTDKDGYLNREEFAKAFAGLKPEAFDLIDKDKDGRISRDEWTAFSSGHGSRGEQGGHGSGEPAKQQGKETLPVVPVPRVAPQGSSQGAGK